MLARRNMIMLAVGLFFGTVFGQLWVYLLFDQHMAKLRAEHDQPNPQIVRLEEQIKELSSRHYEEASRLSRLSLEYHQMALRYLKFEHKLRQQFAPQLQVELTGAPLVRQLTYAQDMFPRSRFVSFYRVEGEDFYYIKDTGHQDDEAELYRYSKDGGTLQVQFSLRETDPTSGKPVTEWREVSRDGHTLRYVGYDKGRPVERHIAASDFPQYQPECWNNPLARTVH